MNETPDKIANPFDTENVSWKDAVKNLLFLACIIGIIYFFAKYIGFDNLRLTVEKAGPWAPLIIIILKATTIVIVPLGGMPLYPIAGALFGFWQGLGITLIGDTLGSTIAFYLSRYFGQKIFRYVMPRKYVPIIEKLVRSLNDIKTFAKVRLFFSGIPELFAYAAGLTTISFFIFLPIHITVHTISAGLFVAFGDLIISGNVVAITVSTLASMSLILAGMWWFHQNITEGS